VSVSPAEADLAVPASRRTHPSVFGMVLFLASELMLFGSLFAAYFTLRSIAETWPPPDVDLDMALTLVATVVLTSSSGTMHAAVSASRTGRPASPWLFVTFALGAVFLAIKAYEFAVATFGVSSHAYGSLFFTMLGAHAVHLLVGMVLLLVVVARPLVPRTEAVGLYWHFVDAVWLAIFGTVYLIR
jgi:cytochrome c oxidase subunit III